MSVWGLEAWTLGNGVEVERTLDPATGRITAITAGPNHDASLVSLAYAWDARGNVTEAFDVLTGVGYQTPSTSYDALERLSSFDVHDGAAVHNRNATYQSGGNLAGRTGVGSYAYTDTMPHAVTKTTLGGAVTHYHYNGVGEMTSGPSLAQIDWTRGGRVKQLVGATTTSLAYGANGHLVQKSVAGTTSRYVGRLLVKIGDSWRARIVANGEVIAIVKINAAGVPTTDYLVHDAQGSPAALLSASGELVARFAWNAWGELVDPADGTGPDPNADQKHALTTLGYTGHEMLWEAGLVHTYARLYNAHIGRWLSPDPTVPNLYNGQSLNRYGYVLNNPLTYVDPLGFDSWRCNPEECELTVIVHPCPPGMVGSIAPFCYNSTLFMPGSGAGRNGLGGNFNGQRGPRRNQKQQKKQEKNHCGSSQGIPAGEVLTPASPLGGIYNGSKTVLVTAHNASQIQVAATNLSPVAPAVAIVNVSFQLNFTPYVLYTPLLGSLNNTAPVKLGESTADILFNTTHVFRSQPFGILGPGPLSLNVTIDVKNLANVAIVFCGIGIGPTGTQ